MSFTTRDAWQRNFKAAPKKHKYNAKITTVAGQTFPSRLEADVFCELKVLEMGGLIQNLERHGTVRLTEAGISYKPDFQAFHVEHQTQVFYEAKGVVTDRWRLVKKLWKAYGPGRLYVYKSNGRGVYLAEEIVPERAA